MIQEVVLSLMYKDLHLNNAYRIDLLVENQLVVEIKAIDKITPVHFAQTLSYLKMGDYNLGLSINFNVPLLASCIKRIINK